MGDDIDQAFVHYDIALGELEDRDLSLYVYVNDYLFPQLRQDEAKKLLRSGLEDDPASLIMSQSLAMTESRAGNYNEALEIISRVGATDGGNFLVSSVLVDVFYRSRDIKRLRQAAEQSIEKIGLQNGFIMQYLLQAHVLDGDLEGAEEILNELLGIREQGGFLSATVVGMSLASLGRIEEAAPWFVRAHRERDYWLRWHLKSAIEDIPSLGEHPAIINLLQNMGLDDTSIAARIAAGR
jgi:tetratricopeptide (TPR) repeat protein